MKIGVADAAAGNVDLSVVIFRFASRMVVPARGGVAKGFLLYSFG